MSHNAKRPAENFFFSITSESHPFGPITNGKSGQAAQLNPFIPIQVGQVLNQKLADLAYESLQWACCIGPTMQKIWVFLYSDVKLFFGIFDGNVLGPLLQCCIQISLYLRGCKSNTTQRYQINCNQTLWHQSGSTDVGTQLTEATNRKPYRHLWAFRQVGSEKFSFSFWLNTCYAPR